MTNTTPSAPEGPATHTPTPWAPARSAVVTPAMGVGLDLALVLLFAAIGRRSHAEGMSVAGVLSTWWPFALGVLVGWGLVHWRSHRDALPLGPGITVWLCVVIVGMLLRPLTGGGVALSFVLVTLLVTGVMLLGWRLIAQYLHRQHQAAELTSPEPGLD